MDLYNIISTQSRHPAPRSVWGHIHEYSEPFLWRRVIVEIGCVICYSCVKILPITLSPGGDSGVAFNRLFIILYVALLPAYLSLSIISLLLT